MWIGYKHVLMNEGLLDRVRVVEVPRDSEVRNSNGTIQVLVPEPGTTSSWWFSLSNLSSLEEKTLELAKSLLVRAAPLIEQSVGTKRAKLELLHDFLDINFAELRRKS